MQTLQVDRRPGKHDYPCTPAELEAQVREFDVGLRHQVVLHRGDKDDPGTSLEHAVLVNFPVLFRVGLDDKEFVYCYMRVEGFSHRLVWGQPVRILPASFNVRRK